MVEAAATPGEADFCSEKRFCRERANVCIAAAGQSPPHRIGLDYGGGGGGGGGGSGCRTALRWPSHSGTLGGPLPIPPPYGWLVAAITNWL